MIFLLSALILISGAVSAQEPVSPSASSAPIPSTISSHLPTYVALSPNLNDFGQFADGGPDSNWYVGFNNAWIVKLPSAPAGNYKRAFIGAKLGRAKTQPKLGRPWEHEVIPGNIYIGISNEPAFSPEQSFFLVETKDIPIDPDPRAYVAGEGQSQWFWVEVPSKLIDFTGPNYLIIWSPTDYFVSADSSPILAAAEGGWNGPKEDASAWVNRSILGVPPRKADGALETPIRHLYPGLAIKLVPEISSGKVTVEDCGVESLPKGAVFNFSIEAENAGISWIERSQDRVDWERVSGYLRHPPYQITLTPGVIPPQGAYFRAVASDISGNQGSCEAVFISPTHASPQ